MDGRIIVIPTNYTDSGKLLGLFEKRNTLEAACFALPVILLLVLLSPFNINVNIIIGAVILVPLCGFSLFGVRDYSLLQYLLIYFKWRRDRRKITYKGREKECRKRRKRQA